MKRLILALFALSLAGCASEADHEDMEISKEEAAAQAGKGDTFDYCELLGWYDDDECDAFCPWADSECRPTCGTTRPCEDEQPAPREYICDDGEVIENQYVCRMAGYTNDCYWQSEFEDPCARR